MNQKLYFMRLQLYRNHSFYIGSATGTTTKRLTSSAAVKSARATYKKQMKIEQAAAAEELEARKVLEGSTGKTQEPQEDD